MESELLWFIILTVIPSLRGHATVLGFRDNLNTFKIEETAFGHHLKPARWARQATKVTESEKLKLVELHNMYRDQVVPSAADMEYMEWDDRLAEISQAWSENCKWKHGNVRNEFSGGLGQNLYRGTSPKVAYAMKLWFDEYLDYDFDTMKCKPNKQCGHYTQVVWATSRYVGCGITHGCWPDTAYNYYIVCNYWPIGNFQHTQPYLKGKPCSLCNSTGVGLCAGKSCVSRSQCKRLNLNCACDLTCYNCGELDKENCKCNCRDGWTSPDCTKPCLDLKKCDVYDCVFHQDKSSSNHPCAKHCGTCKGVNQSDLRNTCCDGVLCPHGQVYYPSDRPCSCRTLCPGPKCGARLHEPYFVLLVVTIALSKYCFL